MYMTAPVENKKGGTTEGLLQEQKWLPVLDDLVCDPDLAGDGGCSIAGSPRPVVVCFISHLRNTVWSILLDLNVSREV